MRGACKECKVQCVPVEEACPGVQDLEAGFWNRTTKKVLTQYIQRAADIASEREFQRRENQFAKEQAKVWSFSLSFRKNNLKLYMGTPYFSEFADIADKNQRTSFSC